jgi:CRISPR-associated protein Cas8b1/Cst1 subtype I-B
MSLKNGEKTKFCRCCKIILFYLFEAEFHFKIRMNTRMYIMNSNEAAVGHFVTTEMAKLH